MYSKMQIVKKKHIDKFSFSFNSYQHDEHERNIATLDAYKRHSYTQVFKRMSSIDDDRSEKVNRGRFFLLLLI